MNQSHTRPQRSWSLGGIIHRIENTAPSDRLLLRVLFFCIIAGFVWSAWAISDKYLVSTPVSGGTIVEGIVGIPRFVNPVLAVTRADQDMSALLFRGLMKIDTSGQLVPDLAESVTTSSDGLTYNVILRNDQRFHDDTPLTARDVAFTIGLIQNPDLKSPLRGNWIGITVEVIDEYELNIVLDETYPPFIENFTVGIIPRHIWNELPLEQVPFSQRNTEPIGSGHFKIDTVTRNDAGLIESYQLVRAHDDVKLKTFIVRFYQNEEALVTDFTAGKITNTTNLPLELVAAATDDYHLIEEPLPRTFGIFLNQNKVPMLRDAGAREALDTIVDREALVANVLYGHGFPTNTPVPPRRDTVHSMSTEGESDRLTKATLILQNSGWQKNQSDAWEKRIDGNVVTLSITLRTTNTPLFERTAEAVANAWRELGVQVNVEQYEQSDLLQAVIRPRDFEALLFGLDMNRTVDLYPFWHSSQREDPGLNITQYANIEVDTLLAEARTTSDVAVRQERIASSSNIIAAERPAIFLFVPSLTYLVRNNVTTSDITQISRPSERFMNIAAWHTAREDRWPFLTDI